MRANRRRRQNSARWRDSRRFPDRPQARDFTQSLPTAVARREPEPENHDYMISLKESFCARFRCSESDFVPRVFWHCLHRGPCFVVPLVALFQRDYFQPAWMMCKPQTEATVTEGGQ